jgi:hypothetical protein
MMSAVWEHSRQEGGALLLMLAIADHANDAGLAFPSIERLARKARLTPRQIYRLVQQLLGSGEIEIEHGGGRHRSNLYKINLAALGTGTAEKQPPTTRSSVGTASKIEKHTQRERLEYPPEFDKIWAAFPKRDGGNPKKDAYRAYRARLHDKPPATPAELLASVQRYACYAQAKGIVGTDKVQMLSTYLGPNEHWKEPWNLPQSKAEAPTRVVQTLAEFKRAKGCP